mmetsp:Transcript_29075/g.65055  ORF Transcript_29075/g.65055 Transcript_29075/m.65055 type:complete len:112 (+) Transcript_29075:863-1198(+)
MHQISGVPVVDGNGRVVDVYSRSDITFLAAATDAESVITNLDLTIQQVLSSEQRQAPAEKDKLHTVNPRASLQAIFELFADVGFQRVVACDEAGRCLGVVTARDLIDYFCV